MNIGLQWSAWKPASYLVKHLQFERQCSFSYLYFLWLIFCLYICLSPPDWLSFSSLSVFVLPFFSSAFIPVCLSLLLSSLLPPSLYFFPPQNVCPFLSLLSVSLCIMEVHPAESAAWLGLPGHPGFNGGGAELDGQPVRLYLPLLRAAPQAPQAQQRQEGQYPPEWWLTSSISHM